MVQLNKILLRFREKQPVEFSKQPVELVWQQSQTKSSFSNPFQSPLSVKQPVESTFQQVEFSHSLEKTSFSKGLRFN